jgi:hypothetical protein
MTSTAVSTFEFRAVRLGAAAELANAIYESDSRVSYGDWQSQSVEAAMRGTAE